MQNKHSKLNTKHQGWTDRFTLYQSSCKRVVDFGADEGVSIRNFYRWKQLFNERTQVRVKLNRNTFIEVGALARTQEFPSLRLAPLNSDEVSIDTNHLKRVLRVILLVRKNWMFSWTALGVKHLGKVLSLMVTCRLHDVDFYD